MKTFFSIAFVLAAVFSVLGQHGGKAEPKRIVFTAGRSDIILSELLKNGEEMEYIFAARKGQHVTVKNQLNGLFDFRIFSEEFDMETEFDSSRQYTFEMPETGDYQFFVRKKLVRAPRSARFRIVFAIK